MDGAANAAPHPLLNLMGCDDLLLPDLPIEVTGVKPQYKGVSWKGNLWVKKWVRPKRLALFFCVDQVSLLDLLGLEVHLHDVLYLLTRITTARDGLDP